MPNWVYNGLTIEGNPNEVDNLVEQMNKPFISSIVPNGDLAFSIDRRKYINPVFAFHNIIAPTDLEAYNKQPDFQSDKPYAGNDWYSWNCRNWGVKWDVAVAEDEKYPETYMEGPVVNGNNKVVYYNFNTAWGIPEQAITNLSAQYPSLLFSLSYQEETGWGGECEFLRGVMISQSEYDNMCRDCDATNQMEYCENDCGEICGNCNWLGEADLEAVKTCQTHAIYLDTKVPEYRKVES
jgi:hypothetical protein